MKVLMFGWEFPPHISGGLGTACYGLTKGLAAIGDLEIIFVIPKAFGDEDKSSMEIIGANDVEVRQRKIKYNEIWKDSEHTSSETVTKDLTYIEIGSKLIPYLSPDEYEKVIHEHKLEDKTVRTFKEQELINSEESEYESIGKFQFTGKYGANLMEEVANYAVVAGEIASHHQFDVIHAHDWLTYAAGVAAKRATGKPLVVHVHATEFDRSGESVNQVVYDIERLGMENADMVITVSNWTKRIVVERYGIPAEKVVTVYNAVEPIERKQEFKKSLDDKIVTFLGRITFQKGPEYFVEAAYKVLQKEKNVRFVMAGSGDMLRRMIRRTAELGIVDRFHFTDFLKGDDVDHMFAISDVYVMPSVSEPFGISPLEAMRSNVPVIISKQSGVAEILQHALTVDYWDVDGIADKIYGLLKYEALSEMFSKYGKQEVDNLKWENAAVQVRNVYRMAVNRVS